MPAAGRDAVEHAREVAQKQAKRRVGRLEPAAAQAQPRTRDRRPRARPGNRAARPRRSRRGAASGAEVVERRPAARTGRGDTAWSWLPSTTNGEPSCAEQELEQRASRAAARGDHRSRRRDRDRRSATHSTARSTARPAPRRDAEVEVGQVRDAEAVELARQPRHGQLEHAQPDPARLERTPAAAAASAAAPATPGSLPLRPRASRAPASPRRRAA